jgi:hypothetical protein
MVYSELIKTLFSVERHNELFIWNSNQGPVGAKPLLEVHDNSKNQTPKDANKMAILDPPKARTSARDPLSLEVLRARETIPC